MNMNEKMTEEEAFEAVKLSGLTDSVQKYLADYFTTKKNLLWRQFCNAEPKFETLLQLQQAAKQITLLEQDIMIDKAYAKEAADVIKKAQEKK